MFNSFAKIFNPDENNRWYPTCSSGHELYAEMPMNKSEAQEKASAHDQKEHGGLETCMVLKAPYALSQTEQLAAEEEPLLDETDNE